MAERFNTKIPSASQGARVSLFPVSANVDLLWQRYQKLAAAAVNNPQMLSDRGTCEALARAHEEWRVAFLREDRA